MNVEKVKDALRRLPELSTEEARAQAQRLSEHFRAASRNGKTGAGAAADLAAEAHRTAVRWRPLEKPGPGRARGRRLRRAMRRQLVAGRRLRLEGRRVPHDIHLAWWWRAERDRLVTWLSNLQPRPDPETADQAALEEWEARWSRRWAQRDAVVAELEARDRAGDRS